MGELQQGSDVGGYTLTRLLGEGGMGEVWLAHDERADRLVALKFIKSHLLSNPKTKMRFTNEAKTLGKLDHDRVVPLYAVVEEGEHLAFVLRFIDGGSLADRIETQYPLPESFILSSSRDILGALGDAHSRGIIHRDMKPQNILIDRQDRSFLTDFGIAISESQERATQGAFAIGTPHYMSPEQIARPRELTIGNGGHRTDIYSYGVVLFEMLTGQVPFGQDSGAEETFAIQQAHCVEPPPPLRTLNPNVSPALEAVVLHCLEKEPNKRPQTCAELLGEIEEAVKGESSSRSVRRATVLDPTEGATQPPLVRPEPRPGTLVETLGKPLAIQTVQSAKRGPSRIPMMIAAAVLLIAAAAGGGGWLYTRGSAKDSGASQNNQQDNQQNREQTTKPSQPGPGTGVSNPNGGKNPPGPVIHDGSNQGGRGDGGKRPNNGSGQSPLPQPQPPPQQQIASPETEANGYANQARALADKAEWCPAQALMQRAIDTHLNSKAWEKDLQAYTVGCTSAPH